MMTFKELTAKMETASEAEREVVVHQYFDKPMASEWLDPNTIPAPLHATLERMAKRGELRVRVLYRRVAPF